MSWIEVSIVLFLSSVILYLFVRKSLLIEIPNIYNNLAIFIIPTILLFPIIIYTHRTLLLTMQEYLLILIAAIFFSYLGNVFSLLGIKRAPNPGYSLIISKSYVVMTSILAIFLFHQSLTIKSFIAIACIVLFSGLIVIKKSINKEVKKLDNSWLLYAIGSFLCWGFLALMSKFVLSLGVNTLVYVFYLLLFGSLCFLVQAFIRKEKYTFSSSTLLLLFMIGIMNAVFNICQQIGYVLAPNIGYINAVNAASVSLLTLASAYFFKDELTIRKLIGVFGVTVGLLLLFI